MTMPSRLLSYLLVTYLAAGPLDGQLSPAAQQTSVGGLSIIVVEGEGVPNNIGKSPARDLLIQVVDEKKKPVAGAAVAFTLPSQGASGTFANGALETTVMTDSEGVATVRALRPNKLPGKVEVLVLASYKGQTARATITQFNLLVRSTEQKASGSKVAIILSIIGAAAAGGAYAGLHKSPSAPTPTAPPPALIGINPGTGRVGGPQ